MAKKNSVSTAWFCKECGAESAKWEGRCRACGAWNTMVEQRVATGPGAKSRTAGRHGLERPRSQAVSEIEVGETERYRMPSGELNRVLGGGLVPGSIVLIGGEPGIGKSTLVLQNVLSIRNLRVLYASGEESPQQLKMRADRIGRLCDNVFILSDTSLESILDHADELEPGLLVVDSIQTVSSEAVESVAGSVSQVRECAAQLMHYAKTRNVPVLLIGHITKEGTLAGPKVLEHIVDTVLQFEGDSRFMYRLLRPIKNRFGSTSELGIYEMCRKGLKEVPNPSMMLLSTHIDDGLSGVAIGVTVDGARPFLIETQALVSTAAYGTAQRSVTGFDPRRLNMLLAVLEKRAGFRLAQKDVFLNIAGGIKVNDPALDLAVATAVMSSNLDMPLPLRTCLAGEIGLSGEIRPVTRIAQRLSEARKLGMSRFIMARGNLKGVEADTEGIEIIEASKLNDVFKNLFRD